MNFFRLIIAVLISLAGTSAAFCRDDPSKLTEISVSGLPPEGRDTLALIKKGGPYPYQRDGVVFGNFEKLLPARARGHYTEFTVPTAGAKTRGARRIVAGKDGEFFYTDDHYQSFKRVRE